MKKILIRIAIAVVVLFVVVLAVVFFSLNSIVKKGVETVGPMLTKVEVRLGSAKISPLSGGGELSKLFVGNPEGYKTPSAIQVGNVKVSVKIGSVLSDTIVVNEVNVQAPEITLEGSLSGNNLTKILDNLNSSSAGEQQPKQAEAPGKKAQKKIIVKDFVMNGGIVHLSMPMLGGKAATVSLPPLHLQDIGTAENGVTPAQLAQKIMTPLLASVTEAATKGVADLGKELQGLGKGGADNLGKAAKGLKGLFNGNK